MRFLFSYHALKGLHALRKYQDTSDFVCAHLSLLHVQSTPSTRKEITVVGAGPVGLTMSLLLSKLGIEHHLIERKDVLSQHPQAHFINNRSMEIFRSTGQIGDQIYALCPPLREWRQFIYCHTMMGEIYGSVDHFKGTDVATLEVLSPCRVAHLPQNALVPLLMDEVQSSKSLAEVHLGQEVKSVEKMQVGYRLHLSNQHGSSRQLECQYLVAAEGAHSLIRKQLGINLSGTPSLQHLINIHFLAPELGQALLRDPDRAAMIYFVYNKHTVAAIVGHNLRQGEFVAQVPYYPPHQSIQDFPIATCEQLIRHASGLQSLRVHVKEIRAWAMSALVADRFSSGTAFLVGDAAHQFPPAGGFGMNTGIQDAHNLAWKLAAVVKGHAGSNLLDTYHSERRPVALTNTALSIQNWKEAVRVPTVLGLDPRAANLLNTVISAAPIPGTLAKSCMEAGMALGRSLAGTSGLLGSWRRQQLDQIFTKGETLRLQFVREDLGFSYNEGALVKGRDEKVSKEPTSEARGAPYVPKCLPGHRFPHLWLRQLSGQTLQSATNSDVASADPAVLQSGELSSSGRVSTLDVVAQSGGKLLLFTDEEGEGWIQAGRQLAASHSWISACIVRRASQSSSPLTAAPCPSTAPKHSSMIGAESQSRQDSSEAGFHIQKPTFESMQFEGLSVGSESSYIGSHQVLDDNYKDGESGRWNVLDLMEDADASWHRTMKLSSGSVVLVRPDGHVAWCHEPLLDSSHKPSIAVSLLQNAFKTIMYH